MRICLMEHREPYNNLGILDEMELIPDQQKMEKANELISIFVSSIRTAEKINHPHRYPSNKL